MACRSLAPMLLKSIWWRSLEVTSKHRFVRTPSRFDRQNAAPVRLIMRAANSSGHIQAFEMVPIAVYLAPVQGNLFRGTRGFAFRRNF